jgi:hypothetical protein
MPPDSSHDVPSISWDMTTVSKMPPTIVEGSAEAQGLKANPSVGSKLPRATRAREEATQRVASNWRIRSPIEGSQHHQASYLSPDLEVSIMPLCVGWYGAVRIFLVGIT